MVDPVRPGQQGFSPLQPLRQPAARAAQEAGQQRANPPPAAPPGPPPAPPTEADLTAVEQANRRAADINQAGLDRAAMRPPQPLPFREEPGRVIDLFA